MRVLAPVVIGAALFAAPDSNAQNRPGRPWGLWVMPAIGTYGEYGCRGFCGHDGAALTVSWQPSRFVLTARSAFAAGNNDNWDFKDAGLLVGYGTRPGRLIHTHLGIGVGYGQAREGAGRGLTVPVEVQLAWRAFPVLGFALYGWGTMTGPLGGLGLGLQIGKLR